MCPPTFLVFGAALGYTKLAKVAFTVLVVAAAKAFGFGGGAVEPAAGGDGGAAA